MPTITGILLDVSGSMESCVDQRYNQQGSSWSRSIIKVIDELIEQDVSDDNEVFAAAFGARKDPITFDLLNTIEGGLKINTQQYDHLDTDDILTEILDLLKQNGAPHVRNWAQLDDLRRVVEREQAALILSMLKENVDFRKEFVRKCLPVQCRSRIGSATAAGSEAMRLTSRAWTLIPGSKELWDGTTRKSIEEAVEKGIFLIWDMCSVKFGSESIMGVKKAHGILHECTDEKEMSDAQQEKLMKTVDPFIYGGTPMSGAVYEAEELFARPEYSGFNKLLFILSDGDPDGRDFRLNYRIRDKDIYVVCCFITKTHIENPKRLYSTDCNAFEDELIDGAQFMYRFSSHVATEKIPRLPPGWEVDFKTNETKLFFQINNPDLIKDVCAFAKDVVCTKNALSDVVGTISLDLYINQCKDDFEAQNQKGMTCYANAVATVVHLATKRIVGREEGYPDFVALRQELIECYGEDGADTEMVLKEVCRKPSIRLRCRKVDWNGAAQQITEKCPVLARFFLRSSEWDAFYAFYRHSKEGIMSVDDLRKGSLNSRFKDGGHAVVLTSFNSESLKFLNSWGSRFADKGFFRVRKSVVTNWEFFAVNWEESDLTTAEKRAFDLKGAEEASRAMELNAFKNHLYKCPLCKVSSNVREFDGVFDCVKCPRCQNTFDYKDREDIALTTHLNTLWIK